jgi:Asp-tRNA(Asn)/Glu-tRNA(Gln) amidotransferase A subunit family amidase
VHGIIPAASASPIGLKPTQGALKRHPTEQCWQLMQHMLVARSNAPTMLVLLQLAMAAQKPVDGVQVHQNRLLLNVIKGKWIIPLSRRRRSHIIIINASSSSELRLNSA